MHSPTPSTDDFIKLKRCFHINNVDANEIGKITSWFRNKHFTRQSVCIFFVIVTLCCWLSTLFYSMSHWFFVFAMGNSYEFKLMREPSINHPTTSSSSSWHSANLGCVCVCCSCTYVYWIFEAVKSNFFLYRHTNWVVHTHLDFGSVFYLCAHTFHCVSIMNLI